MDFKKEIREIELRALDNLDNEMIVEGYAIRFDEPAIFKIGDTEYREIVKPEALNGADMTDVPLKFEHKQVVARTRSKTLELLPDSKGLFIRAKLANTSAGRDMYELIKRGDMYGMSFAFSVRSGGDYFDREARTRVITGFKKIWDVAGVTEPAYDTTSISARSYFELENEKLHKALENAELRKKLIIKTYL